MEFRFGILIVMIGAVAKIVLTITGNSLQLVICISVMALQNLVGFGMKKTELTLLSNMKWKQKKLMVFGESVTWMVLSIMELLLTTTK